MYMEAVDPPKAPKDPTRDEWERIEPNSPRARHAIEVMGKRLQAHMKELGVGIPEELAKEIATDMWRVVRKIG